MEQRSAPAAHAVGGVQQEVHAVDGDERDADDQQRAASEARVLERHRQRQDARADVRLQDVHQARRTPARVAHNQLVSKRPLASQKTLAITKP